MEAQNRRCALCLWLDVPRECPLKSGHMCVPQEVYHCSDRTLAWISCLNSVGSSVPQEDILAYKSKGSVYAPLGLCGVTAGSTVAVAFEPAGPGSTPPGWPNSGESVQASTTCRDRRRRSSCGRLFVLQLQWPALQIPLSWFCFRRNVWPTRLTARKWLTT